MRRYDLYILDFDGTAFDTVDSLVDIFNAGFNAIGRECTKEEVEIYMCHSLEETCQIAGVKGDDIKPFVDSIMDALNKELSSEKIKPFPELSSFIKKVKENDSLTGFVSNNANDHIERVLSLNGIEKDTFDFVIGFSPKRRTKPYPDMLDYACEITGIAKEKACYIGDALQDYEAAKNAGIDGFLLDRRGIHRDFDGQIIKSLLDVFPVAEQQEKKDNQAR